MSEIRGGKWFYTGLYMIGYGTKKNNFEITAFLNYEQGTSRAGNSKSNENIDGFVFI